MRDWDKLLEPWHTEPVPVPESRFTPWAEPGWYAWNEHAAEVQVANFLGELSAHFDNVVESGVGQGFVTRRLEPRLMLVGLESDPEWLRELWNLGNLKPHFLYRNLRQSVFPYGHYDLWILDSNFPLRIAEFIQWLVFGDPDSICFVHDTGTKHPPNSGHYQMGQIIRLWHGGGMFLDNPRGSWVGLRDPQLPIPAFIEEIWQRNHP